MFTKKSSQDVKKSTIKIQDSKKDSATRLKHLKIVLDHYDADEAKIYFEANFSHVYFILYDNFIQAENNLKQRELPFHLVHKAGKEELEATLALLEKVLCLLPELIGKRWQLHSLSRIFSKLLHPGNTHKLRAEAIRYFLLWYQALGDNAPVEVHKMFATLVPGMPEPCIRPSGSPLKPMSDFMANISNEKDYSVDDIMQHPNFADSGKKVVVEQTPTGIMGKLANVSASIFHDTNALNPVQSVDIQPLLPAGSNERPTENETKFFLEILLEAMANTVTKVYWRDRSHMKSMRCFAFMLDRFKMYYLPVICPQFDPKNSLYKPNLELPVQHNILEDNYVQCRVTLIKWVANYAHYNKRGGSDGPASMASGGSGPPSGPPPGPPHEEETSFTVAPSDSSRASSHDSTSYTHPSLDSAANLSLSPEEPQPERVARDVLCGAAREHVDFTAEVLRQAFLLPFAHAAAARRVIALYKDWIQMNVSEVPPFLLEPEGAGAGEPPVPPRRLRNDSYIGAINRDNVLVRAGLQNVLQTFMTQAASVFVATGAGAGTGSGTGAGAGTGAAGAGAGAVTGAGAAQLLEEQTDTCKRVLNIYRYMVMHVAMDDSSWEQLLLVLLQITSLVLTKVPTKRKQDTLGGHLAPALFQTLIVTWIKANLNVAVRAELWGSFTALLARLTHWEELVNEWAKTMETLTRVLARHVYALELSETSATDARRRRPAAPRAAPPPPPPSARGPGKSPKAEAHPRKEGGRRLTRARSDPHLARAARAAPAAHADEAKEPLSARSRRWYSLDSLRAPPEERDSASGSRSPSPAPSSGVESSSIKDSPLQLDLASDGGNVEWSEGDMDAAGAAGGAGGAGAGVALGGAARGWLPDVAAVLWRRMLAALGDPLRLQHPPTHQLFFNYLIHLNQTLLKISANQSLHGNAQVHVPFNLVAGWCLEAETLPPTHRAGKLLALRLLCESTAAQEPGAPAACAGRPHLAHLQLYQRALHHGLTGEDRSVVDVLVAHAAPRCVSLARPGQSLLLLDFVHAATVVLNSADLQPSCPRTAAVTFLGSLLALPDALMHAPMLQPYPHQYNTVSCPDLKEHVLNIVVRVCRREQHARARVAGACALAGHVTCVLAERRVTPRLPEYVVCLLHMLMMKNKNIAKVVSDTLFALTDYTDRIVELYPGLADTIIRWICACLAALGGGSSREAAALAAALLRVLGELCVRCGPARLLRPAAGGPSALLSVFQVLDVLMAGGAGGAALPGLAVVIDEDFDPAVAVDNLGPRAAAAAVGDVRLWAQTICTQLVQHLGHWPLWSACRLSSGVGEHHDSAPSLGAELAAPVLAAPHVQFLRLGDAALASVVELPAMDMQVGTTPGVTTSRRVTRVILRDIGGKSCWDAAALHYDPGARDRPLPPLRAPDGDSRPRDSALSSLPPPLAPGVVPDHRACPPDKHQLDHVLSYIGRTSPEVVGARERLDAAGAAPLPPGAEDALLAALAAHRNVERQYARERRGEEEPPPVEADAPPPPAVFQQSCRLLAQLGVLSPARRAPAALLRRADRLLRELRNLDLQRCRETHKVAVIYVGPGQEARAEILANRCGSPAYEAFLAALAWEVDLESHTGFAGGLRGGGGGGVSAPYCASLTMEALFHVATRMPGDTPEAILNKTRHLGNDEVHVVWTEHWRAYRRDTLPTQFCDVLLCLHPLAGGLLRCTVARKPDVPIFGPLWEESVVGLSGAAALVRAAAAGGGRAVRSALPLYQPPPAERARALHAVAAQLALRTSFETFVMRVREPVPPPPPPPPVQAEQSTGRLAAALLDPARPWPAPGPPGLPGPPGPPGPASPRPAKRAGPFKRPPASPPAPLLAPRKNR